MKATKCHALLALTICGAALILSACGKKEEPAPPVTGEAQKPAGNIAAETQKQAADVKAAAESTAAEAQKQGQATAAAAQGQVQNLMDRAKGLFAEKKYTEAMSSLNELSKLQLTADQQKWLDDLKAQIQKAITAQAADKAAKSAGDLLPKN